MVLEVDFKLNPLNDDRENDLLLNLLKYQYHGNLSLDLLDKNNYVTTYDKLVYYVSKDFLGDFVSGS
jgi:hypothetical protein